MGLVGWAGGAWVWLVFACRPYAGGWLQLVHGLRGLPNGWGKHLRLTEQIVCLHVAGSCFPTGKERYVQGGPKCSTALTLPHSLDCLVWYTSEPGLPRHACGLRALQSRGGPWLRVVTC